jgi:hypothetical protein
MEDKLNLNLLPSQAKFQAAKMKIAKKSKKLMVAVAVIYLIVALAVFGAFGGALWWRSREMGKYQNSLTALTGMKTEVLNTQLVKYRAKILGKVLNERFEYGQAFTLVGEIFSKEAKISNLELKKDSGFKLSLMTSKREVIDEVERKVKEANRGDIVGVSKINLLTVVFDKSKNEWLINMEIILK